MTTLISWLIARRQIKANVISTNRHVWINELRDEIAKMTTSQAAYNKLMANFTTGNVEQEKLESEIADRARLSHYKLRLMLSGECTDYKTLLAIVNGFMERSKTLDELINSANRVLEKERQRAENV